MFCSNCCSSLPPCRFHSWNYFNEFPNLWQGGSSASSSSFVCPPCGGGAGGGLGGKSIKTKTHSMKNKYPAQYQPAIRKIGNTAGDLSTSQKSSVRCWGTRLGPNISATDMTALQCNIVKYARRPRPETGSSIRPLRSPSYDRYVFPQNRRAVICKLAPLQPCFHVFLQIFVGWKSSSPLVTPQEAAPKNYKPYTLSPTECNTICLHELPKQSCGVVGLVKRRSERPTNPP